MALSTFFSGLAIRNVTMDIKLLPLTEDDREQFILDNQEAFNYGALQEFGRRDSCSYRM